MDFNPVNLHVLDRLTNQGMPGVKISVYTMAGVFVAMTTTDVNGNATALLPDDTYELRLYAFGALFDQPVSLVVEDAPSYSDIQEFELAGEKPTAPFATDARYCVASGYFTRANNTPLPYGILRFKQVMPAMLVEERAVIGASEIKVRLNERGYGQVQLLRYAQYAVTIEWLEDQEERIVHVPNVSAVNLANLLFPTVKSVEFAGGVTSLQIPLGTSVDLGMLVRTTDLRVLEHPSLDMDWLSSDSSIVDMQPADDKITFVATKVGTTLIGAQRKADRVLRIPDTPIQGLPLTITVVLPMRAQTILDKIEAAAVALECVVAPNYAPLVQLRGLQTRLRNRLSGAHLPTHFAAKKREGLLADNQGCRRLLLEIVRRAVYDWVLYKNSPYPHKKSLAEDAHYWLFEEGPSSLSWGTRLEEDKRLTAFLVLCDVLELDPNRLRRHVRTLTPQQILSSPRAIDELTIDD